MSKIAIVVDSTTYLSPSLKLNPDIYVAHTQVLINKEIYFDQKTINSKELFKYFENPSNQISTSQPAIGEVMDLFESLKTKGYDHVYCLSISGKLSGTFNGFVLAQNEVQLPSIDLIDTLTVCGPVTEMVEFIVENKDKLSREEILKTIEMIMDNTETYLYPSSLQRLILSGRLNKAVGTVANLLKLRILLALKNKGDSVEKLEIYRTEKKLLSEMVELTKSKMDPNSRYVLYILDSQSSELVESLLERIAQEIGDIPVKFAELPAAITTHIGIGAIAIQWVKVA